MSVLPARNGDWFKSNRSSSNAACVEVRFDTFAGDGWFKSSRSSCNAACVEVRFAGAVGVRDSKDREGPALGVAPGSWAAFIADLKSGHHDAT